MTTTSRRSVALVAWAVMLALASVLGTGGASVSGEPVRTVAAASLSAPAAAPDNSIVLQPFLAGLTSPVFITHAGDGSGRLFVVEQGGLIKVVVNGTVRPTPFLDLRPLVQSGGEQGLLGLAFHPAYVSSGRFFVFYTAKPPAGAPCPGDCGNDTLAEYRVSGNPEVADPTPVRTLFSLPDRASNHNAGMLAFSPADPNRYLYVSTGDEGGGGDTYGNSQNLNSLYAKILRLDVDNIPNGQGYGIPPGNPFVGQAGVRPEIWAYGFRNPWRWSFDRLTGDILIGDVGQSNWEEIDFIPSNLSGQGGRNFGWNIREGAHCYPPGTASCTTAGLVDPILEYDHTQGCSVTGGYRYRGVVNPALTGLYFYADYCSGRIWKAQRSGSTWTATEALDTTENISAFGEDQSGELYVVGLGGTIFRLTQTAPNCGRGSRPNVQLQSTRTAAGTYSVTVTATDSATVASNVVQSISFNRVVNASISIGTQVDQRAPFTATLPGTSRTASFTVKRVTAGQVMHVDFGVVDRCGPWSTFFGAGTGAP